MWQALRGGWIPPESVTETEYKALSFAKPSPARGFAGFACSYGGKWFGGYARGSGDYAAQGSRGLIKDSEHLKNVSYLCSDFSKVEVNAGDIVYADPPYSGTTKYSATFSSLKFWFTVRKWRELGATVYISEYRAPDDATCIWESSTHGFMKGKQVIEKLFTLEPKDA